MERWRFLATALFLFGTMGVLVELLLLGHYEDVLQWTPLVLLGAGGPIVLAVALRPVPGVLRVAQIAMIGFVIAGALGVYFHLRSNVEFELEMRPTMTGSELLWETLTGAIPALAPGAMVQLGLLGLLICYRHPARDGAGRIPSFNQPSEA